MSDNTNGRALALSPAAAPLARALDLDAERMALLCRTLGDEKNPLKPDEVQLFLAVAARTGLDPFLKQVYAIKANGRFFVHVGIDGRRLIAHRTGLVDGTLGPEWCGNDGQWRDFWPDDAGVPVAARFGVRKKGCREPFYAVAHMKGFRSQTGRWAVDPVGMLAKVAEDHAWRKAFPYEMGATPTYRPEHDEDAPAAVDDAPESAGALEGGHSEGEYREIDRETGETTETTGAPAGPDRSGTPGAPDRIQAQGVTSQPAPEDLDAEFERLQSASRPTPGRPAWWDTDLGREISPLVDQLDEAKAKYSLPSDDAPEEELRDWISARRGWLKQHAQAAK